MACKFCFSTESLKPNEVAVFHSDKGEEHRVKYAYEFRDVSVTVEWELAKNALITVDLNTADAKQIASESKVVKGKTVCLTFGDTLISDNPVEFSFIFVISLIPFTEVKDGQGNSDGNTCELIKLNGTSELLENSTLRGSAVNGVANGKTCEPNKCNEMSEPLANTLMDSALDNGANGNICESTKRNEMSEPMENTLIDSTMNGDANGNTCGPDKRNEMKEPLESTLMDSAVNGGAHENTCESNECDELSDPLEDTLIGLATDMQNLLISGYNSDVVLTNGSKECHVHSIILSARSPVFKEILDRLLDEKKITVSEASDEVLDDMIKFIYCGVIKIADMKRAEQLYELACKFKIEDLRDVCSIYLSKLTVDRAVETLLLADKYDDDDLKRVSVNFIAKNLHKLKDDKKWLLSATENFNLITETLSLISGVHEKNNLHAFLMRLSEKSEKV